MAERGRARTASSHCASCGSRSASPAAPHGIFWRTVVAQLSPRPSRSRPDRGDARGKRQVLTAPFTLLLLEPASKKDVRDRHGLPSPQPPLRLIAMIETEDAIKRILSAMGLPTCAPKLWPARPPLSQSGGEGGDWPN